MILKTEMKKDMKTKAKYCFFYDSDGPPYRCLKKVYKVNQP